MYRQAMLVNASTIGDTGAVVKHMHASTMTCTLSFAPRSLGVAIRRVCARALRPRCVPSSPVRVRTNGSRRGAPLATGPVLAITLAFIVIISLHIHYCIECVLRGFIMCCQQLVLITPPSTRPSAGSGAALEVSSSSFFVRRGPRLVLQIPPRMYGWAMPTSFSVCSAAIPGRLAPGCGGVFPRAPPTAKDA